MKFGALQTQHLNYYAKTFVHRSHVQGIFIILHRFLRTIKFILDIMQIFIQIHQSDIMQTWIYSRW